MNKTFLWAVVWSSMLTMASLVDAAPGAGRQRAEFRPDVTEAETYCEYAVGPLGIDAAQP